MVKEKKHKNVVIPKSAEYMSDIAQELVSGSFSESNIGRLVSPTELSDAIKKSGGRTHTTTVQNFAGVLAVGKFLRESGWDVVEIKGGYYALQKTSEGKTTLEDIDKTLKEIKKLLKK